MKNQIKEGEYSSTSVSIPSNFSKLTLSELDNVSAGSHTSSYIIRRRISIERKINVNGIKYCYSYKNVNGVVTINTEC